MHYPPVTIIILNWNGWEDTIQCLESLYEVTYPTYNIILVDNGSTDDSCVQLTRYLKTKTGREIRLQKDVSTNTSRREENSQESAQGQIERLQPSDQSWKNFAFMKNEQNYGFAKGNNLAIKYATAEYETDYFVLLNNDTVVDEKFLEPLVNVAESDPSIGICAVKLLRIDDPKVIDSTGHVMRWGSVIDRGRGRRDKKQYDNKKNVLGAKAAACLYKKRMLDDIGLFDEDFGTSWEDAELSWRAHRKGWKAKYVPTSLVYHRYGASIKRSPENLSKQILLSTKNEITLVGRYGSNWQKLLFTFGLIKSAFGNINGSLLKHYPLNVKSYIKIVLRGYFMLISAIFSSFLRLQEE